MALMFYLLDHTMNMKRIIETYKSAIWTERYYESGDFELYIPATPDIIQAVKYTVSQTQFIVRADDTRKCGMIENFKITTDAEDGNFVTISGRTLAALPFRRVATPQLTFNGSACKTAEMLFKKNLINPEDIRRKIYGLTFKNSVPAELDEVLTNQYNGDNVGEAIEAICKHLKIGYRALFDMSNKSIEFELYAGTDRSTEQSDVPPVIFSNDFNNLLSSDYTVSVAEWKNAAQILGEGQGTGRMKAVYGSAAGFNRREMYVNAQQTSTNGAELTANTYINMLRDIGAQAVSEHRPTQETEADVAPNYGFILNRDYFLGDVVTVRNEYGVEITPRVLEIIEAQDENGYSIIPTFGIG